MVIKEYDSFEIQEGKRGNNMLNRCFRNKEVEYHIEIHGLEFLCLK